MKQYFPNFIYQTPLGNKTWSHVIETIKKVKARKASNARKKLQARKASEKIKVHKSHKK